MKPEVKPDKKEEVPIKARGLISDDSDDDVSTCIILCIHDNFQLLFTMPCDQGHGHACGVSGNFYAVGKHIIITSYRYNRAVFFCLNRHNVPG